MDHDPCPVCGRIDFCDACVSLESEYRAAMIGGNLHDAWCSGTLFQIIESILAPPADA